MTIKCISDDTLNYTINSVILLLINCRLETYMHIGQNDYNKDIISL